MYIFVSLFDQPMDGHWSPWPIANLVFLPSSNSTPNSISTPTQLNLHFKSIQLLQELSWSYALYLVFTTTTHPPHHITFLNYKTK